MRVQGRNNRLIFQQIVQINADTNCKSLRKNPRNPREIIQISNAGPLNPNYDIYRRMRIFNLVFCILFIIFAALQYNDPDPYVWMPIYGAAAFACYLCYRQKRPRLFLYLILTFCLVYALFLFFDEQGVKFWITEKESESIAGSMKAESPWVEKSREFFGLLIIAGVMLLNLVRKKPATTVG
jgi:hypothetical protein